MIHLEVTMNGNLRRFLPEGVASVFFELPEGTTVSDLIERLNGHNDIWIASIDNKLILGSALLKDGVKLEFFPYLEGG